MNLQPLQSNLKVLQEQQTQLEHSMVWRDRLVKSECDGRMKFSGVVVTEMCAWFGFAGRDAEILRFVQGDENEERPRDVGQALGMTLFFRGGADLPAGR